MFFSKTINKKKKLKKKDDNDDKLRWVYFCVDKKFVGITKMGCCNYQRLMHQDYLKIISQG